jgi:hypothetical protein
MGAGATTGAGVGADLQAHPATLVPPMMTSADTRRRKDRRIVTW